jgi:NAD(P)-dependent dehydrogenase (short-subunit alcohol dehydrogenase family)
MRVIITGSKGGIGSATVELLRSRAASVVGLDLPECDVRDQASVDAAVAGAIDRLGGLDVLINCAGLGTPQSASAAPDSDVLRLEEGDRITVTTVYPGYIRTSIHEQSVAAGVPLEGSVPVEDVSDAARTLVRAALDEPARDLATTRHGTLACALLRLAPRRVVDAFTRAQMKRLAKRGHFAAEGLAGEYAARLRS